MNPPQVLPPLLNATWKTLDTVVISGMVLLCYLELLDKLQKHLCRAVGPPLATSLEPLAHH